MKKGCSKFGAVLKEQIFVLFGFDRDKNVSVESLFKR